MSETIKTNGFDIYCMDGTNRRNIRIIQKLSFKQMMKNLFKYRKLAPRIIITFSAELQQDIFDKNKINFFNVKNYHREPTFKKPENTL